MKFLYRYLFPGISDPHRLLVSVADWLMLLTADWLLLLMSSADALISHSHRLPPAQACPAIRGKVYMDNGDLLSLILSHALYALLFNTPRGYLRCSHF